MFKILNYKKKRKLVAEPGGGLCNRLICLNNAINILREVEDLKLQVVWWKEPECGCKFEDILKPIPGISVVNYARPMETRRELLRKGKLKEAIVATIQNCFFGYYYRESNINRIAGYWSGIEDVTKEKVVSVIRSSAPGRVIYYRMGVEYRTECILSEKFFSNIVLDKFSSVKERFENRHYIGLHIRRTDHKLAIQASPLSFFCEAIEKELSNSPEMLFYLATDDKIVETELKERYGKMIFVNEACARGRKSAEAIQDAAVDLLMLANADKIYGSIGSTFSEIAAAIGSKPLILFHFDELKENVERGNV